MTHLILSGFHDPDSERLAAAVAAAHPDWTAKRASDDLDELLQPDAATDTVALVWCLTTSAAHSGRVANHLAARGCSVIVVTQDTELRGYDVASGNLEFCFNPFATDEVLTRIDVARSRKAHRKPNVIVQGELAINPETFDVRLSGRPIDLTYKEYELLKLLASSPGRVYKREEILDRIWGEDYFGGTRTVDVHVRRLRSKLEDVSHDIIETMWRVGYRFSVPDAPAAAAE